jgi:hypothetical protein
MIRKRGKFFEFEFMESGERIFGTFNGKKGIPLVGSKGQAKDCEFAIRSQVRIGTYGKQPRSEKFAEFFEVYMVYAKENTVDWKHAEFRGEVLKQFFADKKFSEITPLIVVQYINQRLQSVTKRNRKRSPVTINKELRLASAVFHMAIQEGIATVNPCLSIPKAVKKSCRRATNEIGF